MSDKSFIVETTQIRRAVDLLNNIENAKFRLLLQRILQKIYSKTETYFSHEELDKLEKSFELQSDDLSLIIDTIEFIYLQSAYVLIKPSQLNKNLKELKFHDQKSELIASLWLENSKEIIEKLKETRTIAFKSLKGLKWRLQVSMATNLKSKTKLTNALVEFDIQEDNDTNDKFVVEFAKDELYDFYLKLEDIQRQVDNLNK
jgi:hypothetical protein